MTTISRFAFAIACFAACTSKNPKRPPELADCVPMADAACANSATGGVGGGGSGGSGTIVESGAPATVDASTSFVGDAGVCRGATADSLIVTGDITCQLCAATNCCTADQACTGACASVLQCTQNCVNTGQSCVSDCETMSSADLTASMAYQDFAQCLSMHCPQCPALRR